MPLKLIRNINPKACLAVWEIQESTQELQNKLVLTSQEEEFLSSFQVETKRQEFLAARKAAQSIFDLWGEKYQGIHKNHLQKPNLKHLDYAVSLSHTQNLASVLVHQKRKVGIDIEQMREQLFRISHKFLTNTEKEFIGNDLHKMTVAWSAKEALYKLYEKKELPFKHHIVLNPFELQQGFIKSFISPDLKNYQSYTVHFQAIAGHYMAYVVE